MKLGIFTAFRNLHKYYVRSCEELGIEYEIIDIISSNWLKDVMESDCDGFLCRPPSKFQERKSMYDEKLYLINKLLKKPIYPSYEELFIYENKKMMSYWLELNNFPHAETKVFYKKKECLDFLNTCEMPIVIKSNIGSTAKGVEIIKSKIKAKRIAIKIFGYFNTKLAKGHTTTTTGKVMKFKASGTIQKHFMIIQKFEKIKWEWRMIKIGNSYFGHKKLLDGQFASGSKLKGWDEPSKELLFLTKEICDKGKFLSMNVDVFETTEGNLLVNELQSIWGQSTEHLMYVNGKPGRFIFRDNDFHFEEGNFTKYSSYFLRTKHFLEILKNREKK